jgi:hypothetical protein
MPSSGALVTHMRPGQGLFFGRRALHERLARLVRLELPAVLDEPRDVQHPAIEPRLVAEEIAVLG